MVSSGVFVGTGVGIGVAEGSDGKEYKLKGDINIINYNESNGSVDNSGEGVVE